MNSDISCKNDICIQCLHDIRECEKIWKYFHPDPKTVYDDWEYISTLYNSFGFTPYFYVAYKDSEPVACIPLEWYEDKKQLRMFGNRSGVHKFFYFDENYIFFEKILNTINHPIFFESILWENAPLPSFLVQMDTGYLVNLENISSAEAYIQKQFSGDTKRNISRQIRRVSDLGIEMKIGKEEDLYFFFEQNKRKFGEKSGYNDIRRQNNILFMNKTASLHPHILSFYIQNELVAVMFMLEYNKTFYSINGGIKEGINNLGKYTIYSMIQFSISQGGKFYDPGPGDLGWKDAWCNISYPLYGYTLNQI